MTKESEVGATSGMKPVVLVVSRSSRASQMLVRRVEKAGYQAVPAKTDAEAVAGLGRHTVEAVVCHTQSAGASALKLLEQLRERESDSCIIVVGADEGAERAAALLRAGAYDYLTVPIRPGRLEESLRQGLDIRRSFIQVRELSGRLRNANEDLAHERDTLRRWSQTLAQLNHLGQAMAGTLNADEIIRLLKGRLDQIVKHDRLGILWLEPERLWTGGSGAAAEAQIEDTKRALIATGRRLRGASTLASSDPSGSENGKPEASSLTPSTPAQVLEVPLLVAQGQVGLIRLERERGQSFHPDEIEIIKAVATSLALALRNAETHSQVQNMAMTDGLTNLLNRRAFSTILTREFKNTERYGTPLCLIMADLDNFKQVNDVHGHLIGDRLLKEVATLISRAIRAVDVVARYGGEEFAMILPRTDTEPATILATRIREQVANHVFVVNGAPVRLTLSMGVSRIPHQSVTTPDDLVAAADAALYQAKAKGRNCVEVNAELLAAAGAVRD
jgi:two-component system cell cycle response regulator